MSSIHFDVDAVYCISLDTREDRRQLFRESIGEVIDNPVNFHIVQKHHDPKQGCYESHQQLARLALDQGLERILVFEDDVKLRIPRSSGHPFHEHLTTDSTLIRPPIPRASGH